MQRSGEGDAASALSLVMDYKCPMLRTCVRSAGYSSWLYIGFSHTSRFGISLSIHSSLVGKIAP